MIPAIQGTVAMFMTPQVSPSIKEWKESLHQKVVEELRNNNDGSHDIHHINRVTRTAEHLAKEEKANELVVVVAALLHELVNVPKNSPDRSKASTFSAERAMQILKEMDFPSEHMENVYHSIQAHSFSANVQTRTLEAKCVQDADRYDAIGAFGLARTFDISGQFRSAILEEDDPAAENRALDDKKYCLDHFKVKLFTLADTMKTQSGKKRANELTDFLREFYDGIIASQKSKNFESGYFKVARAFMESGKNHLPLCHYDDPLAKERKPEPEKYALDKLIGIQDDYVSKFLAQFCLELQGVN
jgi:uncharacterized protein